VVNVVVRAEDQVGVPGFGRCQRRLHLPAVTGREKDVEIGYGSSQLNDEAVLSQPPERTMAGWDMAGFNITQERLSGLHTDILGTPGLNVDGKVVRSGGPGAL
jgi:hypothetical protein